MGNLDKSESIKGSKQATVLACVICGQPAVRKYEGEPTCGKFVCEYNLQESIDKLMEKQ